MQPAGRVRRCDAEDAFTAWFRVGGGASVEGGASVAIDTSFAHPVTLPSRVTLSGPGGVIEVVNDRYVTVRDADGGREEEDIGRGEGDSHGVAMRRWAERVRDAVEAGAPCGPSFDDGVACALVLDALRSTPVEPRGGA